MELLIGCGNQREKRLYGPEGKDWSTLVTIDNDPNARADVEHDLMKLPLPFPDNHFDEIHAYHVLEHTGAQGDYRWFFAQWEDFWRILKPGGVFFGIVPHWQSFWAWSDPGHTRVLSKGTLVFLHQPQYTEYVSKNAMADYRHVYRADFDLANLQETEEEYAFYLKAVKPSRISV